VIVTNLKPPPVHKVIIAQISATTFIAVVSLVLINASTAFSVLLGGGVSSGSNAFFAAQAFKHRGARNAQKIVKGFLAGEIGKFCITVVMFALSFSLLPNVVEGAMILAFLIVHVVGVAAAVRINYTPNGHKSTPSP
jgi:ATP synthase protein I